MRRTSFAGGSRRYYSIVRTAHKMEDYSEVRERTSAVLSDLEK